MNSPRLVSISIVQDIDSPADTNTLWTMQFGQFITHDIASSPQFRLSIKSKRIMNNVKTKFITNFAYLFVQVTEKESSAVLRLAITLK